MTRWHRLRIFPTTQSAAWLADAHAQARPTTKPQTVGMSVDRLEITLCSG